MILSRGIILKMRNFAEKKVVEKFKNQISRSITFFFHPRRSCRYEIMWKNILQSGRPQMILWRMRIACWIPKATNTHSEYVIIIEFPLRQWLRERASMLRYAYIGCIVDCSRVTCFDAAGSSSERNH